MIEALRLPPTTRVDQRVPKKMLLEQGAITAADNRYIRDGIEEIQWVAAIKPTAVGIPAFQSQTHHYPEIAVLTLRVRPGAKRSRLVTLIHRAIPYPVFLVSEEQGGITISLGHKRLSQGEANEVVLEDICQVVLTGSATQKTAETLFLASLSLAEQPASHIYAIYQGWIDRLHTLEAAIISGRFVPPASAEESARQQQVLAEYDGLEKRLLSLRSQAVKEKRIGHRVTLNLEIKQVEKKLATLAQHLAGSE